VAISGQVGLGWTPEDNIATAPIQRDDKVGALLAPPGARAGTPRDLVMGLDFGTSSTKVVVADRTLSAAYAVPLVDAVGVSTYLLPSALVEGDSGAYALSGPGRRHADLKLAMLQAPTDAERCARVCAFLALVIRSARAWLYEAKRDQYIRADILWSLALGQPADQAASSRSRDHFSDLAKVAWTLAGTGRAIKAADAVDAWRSRGSLKTDDDLEVRAIAELSAQIHGFVSSSHFDARLPNIYLMADVGAGTVDASLFHVYKEKAGAVSFELFTHSVELLGAASFNRFRLEWWQENLSQSARSLAASNAAIAGRALSLIDDLEGLKVPTEYRGRYPESYNHYVKGVEVEYRGGAQPPDDVFKLKVRNQVAGQVLYGAWKARLLTQEDVQDMPFFLCGGGGRHRFYSNLKTTLQRTPNCTWLRAQPRDLALPTNIVAPGVTSVDYDRLSVAYGLSQLNPGVFKQVVAKKPRVATEAQNDWSISLTDKSVC